MPERNETPQKGVCRCEATIDASILEGYACGNPDCWRTAEARASFEAFVRALVAERDRVSKSETGRES